MLILALVLVLLGVVVVWLSGPRRDGRIVGLILLAVGVVVALAVLLGAFDGGSTSAAFVLPAWLRRRRFAFDFGGSK